MMNSIYKRVLLKISGEALAGEQKTGINEAIIQPFSPWSAVRGSMRC